MKKLPFIAAALLAVSATAYIAGSGSKTKKTESESEVSREGMEDDALERMEWETRRLADPATGKIPDHIRQMELAYAATLPNDLAFGKSMMSLTMTNRGPWNLGGRTRAFGVDVSNEN